MVDAMRAMLDELMGEDRDGDRQKCVLYALVNKLDQAAQRAWLVPCVSS